MPSGFNPDALNQGLEYGLYSGLQQGLNPASTVTGTHSTQFVITNSENLSRSDPFYLPGSMAIGVWHKQLSALSGGRNDGICGQWDYGANKRAFNFQFHYQSPTVWHIRLSVSDDGTNVHAYQWDVYSYFGSTVDKWIYYAVVYDSSDDTMRLYTAEDGDASLTDRGAGSLFADDSPVGALYNADSLFQLGAFGEPAVMFAHARMHALTVFNEVRTETQFNNWYKVHHSGKESGVVWYGCITDVLVGGDYKEYANSYHMTPSASAPAFSTDLPTDLP